MPAKGMPPRMRGHFVPMHDHRSISGSSTESHNSSMSVPPEQPFIHDDRKYAPIRPQSQPPHPQHGFTINQQMHALGNPLDDQSHELQQIHQFNNAQHMGSGHNTPIDASFPPFPTGPQAQYAPHNAMHHATSAVQGHFHSMDGGPPDIHMIPMSHMHHQHRDSMSQMGTDNEGRSKRPMNSNAANERELRELIENNQHRSLESIAKEVRSAEKSQKAERAKQLFAMRWLRQFCKADKESVPRSKVYTHYTQRCGNERVDTLNPASFGKLVRVIFPGIATRRLGVRGESKYHYVNLTLIEDPNAFATRAQSPQASFLADRATPMEQDAIRQSARPPTDSVIFPNTAPSFSTRVQPNGENPASTGLLFAEPMSQKLRHDGQGPQTYTQSIKFSASSNNPVQDDSMNLPDIQPYLPAKHDVDLAQSLTALYRTHCTSLIDAVRFVREKQFVKVLNAFNGTMTVPVTKLFDHPSIASWIKACDWYMYQQIIKFVSQLALQVIPQQVFAMLGNISNNLTSHLKNAFKQRPDHVLQAKLEPAVMFSSLLQRLLRVNETAHAAANLLTNDEMRNGMWQDWVRSVRPKRVLESELPPCGQEVTYNILTMEIRQLLEPLASSEEVEAGTDYEGATFAALSSENPFAADVNSSAENIIDRWATFLKSLPARFPNVETRSLLHFAGGVGTAALRDITVNQAASFGGWWITKVWVDEMLLWQAEMGGFLDTVPGSSTATETSGKDGQLEKSTSTGNQDTQQSNPDVSSHSTAAFGLDFSNMPSFTPMADGSRHVNGNNVGNAMSPSKMNQKHMSIDMDFDDSGIGMSLNENTSPTRLFLQNQLAAGHFSAN